jgi:hypothetical protein
VATCATFEHVVSRDWQYQTAPFAEVTQADTVLPGPGAAAIPGTEGIPSASGSCATSKPGANISANAAVIAEKVIVEYRSKAMIPPSIDQYRIIDHSLDRSAAFAIEPPSAVL